MPRKKDRPTSQWRYGSVEDPLHILEKDGRDTYIEFIGEITHEEFAVRIREHIHTFRYNNLYAYKVQLFEEGWISEIAYYSLVAMAEHVMKAVFGGFQPKGGPSHTPLTIVGHAVRLLRLNRGYFAFSWQKREYIVTESRKDGIVFQEPGDAPLPPELRRFFEIFVINIWPKLPKYWTPEEVEQRRAERAIAKAPPVTLLDAEMAPAVYQKSRSKAKPLSKERSPIQPSLLNL